MAAIHLGNDTRPPPHDPNSRQVDNMLAPANIKTSQESDSQALDLDARLA